LSANKSIPGSVSDTIKTSPYFRIAYIVLCIAWYTSHYKRTDIIVKPLEYAIDFLSRLLCLCAEVLHLTKYICLKLLSVLNINLPFSMGLFELYQGYPVFAGVGGGLADND
jgi:hypothetical protein